MQLALFLAVFGCEPAPPRNERHGADRPGTTAAQVDEADHPPPLEATTAPSPPAATAAPETAAPPLEPPVARCPGDRPAPPEVVAEVTRLMRVVTAHMSVYSDATFSGHSYGLLRLDTWLVDEGAALPAVSARYRIRRWEEDFNGGDPLSFPAPRQTKTAPSVSCFAMRFVAAEGGVQLDFPRVLPGLHGRMTPLDAMHMHDGGTSPPFQPTTIPLEALRAPAPDAAP